jgi:outer membrane murein-binding lipoprotein Lpp
LTVSVVVAAAVVAGLIVAGSPEDARIQKLDRRRVADLYSIVDSVNVYWTQHGALPPDLDALSDELTFSSDADPETREPYGYRVVDGEAYELCATFAKQCPSTDDTCSHWRTQQDAEIRGHRAGRQCFEITPRVVEGHR